MTQEIEKIRIEIWKLIDGLEQDYNKNDIIYTIRQVTQEYELDGLE